MFGFLKSPANKNSKQDPGVPGAARATASPFNSDTESDKKPKLTLGRRTSSEPVLLTPKSKSNYFDEEDEDDIWSSSHKPPVRNRHKSKQELDMMSQQELEDYAVDQAEQTTTSVNNCLKIAEDIRQDATRTLDTLHQQGEQIHRTHVMAADMDKDLGRGEKLLNSLGGMFSKPWKPKKTREITGPLTSKDDNTSSKKTSKEQREKLGLAPIPKGKSAPSTPPPESANAMQKVVNEKAKQDDGLSDLSNILGDLKGMAVDMGSELDRQNKALDHLQDDVDELNSRVKGANTRARRLIGK